MQDYRGTMRVGNDLLGTGGEFAISDEVPGDVMATGGTITFTGIAHGDYLGAGGSQTIGGQIDGALRAAGGEVEVESRVGRNATVAGGSIELRRGSVVAGSAYLAGGSVVVDGRVDQSLRIAAGDVVLRGEIGENVTIEAGTLRIAEGTRIGGNLRYRTAANRATIEPGVVVEGETAVLPPRPPSRFPLVLRLVTLGGFLVAGAVAVLLAPRTAAASADAIWTRPGASLGYGILWMVLLPVVAALLMVTVVGIPLAIIACVAWLIALFLGRAVPAVSIGRMVLRIRPGEDAGREVMSFFIGALILIVLQLIPWIGFPVLVVATIVGVGAFVVAAAARRRAPTYAEV